MYNWLWQFEVERIFFFRVESTHWWKKRNILNSVTYLHFLAVLDQDWHILFPNIFHKKTRGSPVGPIINKKCLWQPYLLTDRDVMSNLYRGPSIDTSYQDSVHLVKRVQGIRLKCEKLKDDRCKVMVFSSPCLWKSYDQWKTFVSVFHSNTCYPLLHVIST